jgi:hypothetical protein
MTALGFNAGDIDQLHRRSEYLAYAWENAKGIGKIASLSEDT